MEWCVGKIEVGKTQVYPAQKVMFLPLGCSFHLSVVHSSDSSMHIVEQCLRNLLSSNKINNIFRFYLSGIVNGTVARCNLCPEPL